jgi:hypothetical protein
LRLGGYKYLEVGLWAQHVEKELAQPPHHRVPVQPGQPTGGTLRILVLQHSILSFLYRDRFDYHPRIGFKVGGKGAMLKLEEINTMKFLSCNSYITEYLGSYQAETRRKGRRFMLETGTGS